MNEFLRGRRDPLLPNLPRRRNSNPIEKNPNMVLSPVSPEYRNLSPITIYPIENPIRIIPHDADPFEEAREKLSLYLQGSRFGSPIAQGVEDEIRIRMLTSMGLKRDGNVIGLVDKIADAQQSQNKKRNTYANAALCFKYVFDFYYDTVKENLGIRGVNDPNAIFIAEETAYQDFCNYYFSDQKSQEPQKESYQRQTPEEMYNAALTFLNLQPEHFVQIASGTHSFTFNHIFRKNCSMIGIPHAEGTQLYENVKIVVAQEHIASAKETRDPNEYAERLVNNELLPETPETIFIEARSTIPDSRYLNYQVTRNNKDGKPQFTVIGRSLLRSTDNLIAQSRNETLERYLGDILNWLPSSKPQT